MSDYKKINSVYNHLKSIFVNDKYHGKEYDFLVDSQRRRLKGSNNEEEEDKDIDCELIEDLFLIGKDLGLSHVEIIEAIELIIKTASLINFQGLIPDILLFDSTVQYPYYEDLKKDIEPKHLDKIKHNYPDLYMAIDDPFRFFCRYPNCLTYDYYKNFKYTQILEFSEKNPEHYKRMIEIGHRMLEDETA